MRHSKKTAKQHAYSYVAEKGLNRMLVAQISEQKNEPGWMTDFRLAALGTFERLPMPTWGADLSAFRSV